MVVVHAEVVVIAVVETCCCGALFSTALPESPPRLALVARTVPPVAAEELERVPEERLSCWADVPEDRVALPEDRVVEPEDRVVMPVLLPEERVVPLPVLRVVVPVERLRLSCCTVPEEWVVLLPVLRVVVPVERLRLSCCTAPVERVLEEAEERVVLPLVPRERVWASISGAVSMASAIAKVTADVKILLIASQV